jgi:hypothetical protein
MRSIVFYLCLFVMLGLNLPGQNGITGHPDWQIKPVINSGFIMIHRASIGHLVKGYPSIYELNFSKPTLGNKLWHLENNKPDIGITMQYTDYKNPDQLGYAYTLAPYIEIPLSEKERPSRLIMRVSWGLTYLTKRFDIYNNRKNIAIGSHFNCFAQFRWFWQLPLTQNMRFEPGFTFSHASNGRFRNPNLGLNVVSLNFGLNVLIPGAPKPEILPIDSSLKSKSKNELLFFIAPGFNQKQVNTPTIRTYVASVAYQRNLRNTHKFSAGIDVFYDENYIDDYQKHFNSPAEGINRLRISARVGYSYNVGKLSFPMEIGYYLLQKYNPDADMVSRIGVRYYANSGFVTHFGLRTHFAIAYNFEFGIGYRLGFK